MRRKLGRIDGEFIPSLHFYNIQLTLISFLIDESGDLKWVRALKAFERAAKAYKAKYDRPAVIVYVTLAG